MLLDCTVRVGMCVFYLIAGAGAISSDLALPLDVLVPVVLSPPSASGRPAASLSISHLWQRFMRALTDQLRCYHSFLVNSATWVYQLVFWNTIMRASSFIVNCSLFLVSRTRLGRR